MILQSLNELYSRLAGDPSYEIAPPGFSPQKISFRVVINPDGTFFKVEDARIKNPKGKLDYDKLEVPLHEKRTSGVKAQFLCDKQEYLLGKRPKGKTNEKALKCFQAFKEKHLSAEPKIDSGNFSALCRFLESWKPETEEGTEVLDQAGSNFGVFQIRGQKTDIHDCPKIKEWWMEQQIDDDPKTPTEQCLVTGEMTSVCRLHPDIKGFKSSIALIGVQENTSYESYGRSKTENCPISQEVAFRYATALNALLDGPQRAKHRIYIAGTSTVFWTDKKTSTENSLADIFSGGSNIVESVQDDSKREEIQRLLKAIRSGTKFQQFDEASTGVHILGLEQPNPGRFSIRFYHRTTNGDLIAKLHEHHRCLEIVHSDNEPEIPSIWQLVNQIKILHRSEENGKIQWKEGKEGNDKYTSILAGSLVRSIISGTRYPDGLFAAIIRRIIAEKRITYLRAAMLKAILIRNQNQNIPIMLDEKSPDQAYLLGRLFSALERTQEDALGEVNSGIRDRFYGSASATPANVFPKLIRTFQHHLSKIPSGAAAKKIGPDKAMALKVNRERLVQDILAHMDSAGFPNQLPLKKQGVFAIGYYHQRKDFFTKKDTTDSQD